MPTIIQKYRKYMIPYQVDNRLKGSVDSLANKHSSVPIHSLGLDLGRVLHIVDVGTVEVCNLPIVVTMSQQVHLQLQESLCEKVMDAQPGHVPSIEIHVLQVVNRRVKL